MKKAKKMKWKKRQNINNLSKSLKSVHSYHVRFLKMRQTLPSTFNTFARGRHNHIYFWYIKTATGNQRNVWNSLCSGNASF